MEPLLISSSLAEAILAATDGPLLERLIGSGHVAVVEPWEREELVTLWTEPFSESDRQGFATQSWWLGPPEGN